MKQIQVLACVAVMAVMAASAPAQAQSSTPPPVEVRDVRKIWDGGDPSRNVNLIIMGDGFKDHDLRKFHKKAERIAKEILRTPPWSEFKQRLNIWRIDVASPVSGIKQNTDAVSLTPFGLFWLGTILRTVDYYDAPRLIGPTVGVPLDAPSSDPWIRRQISFPIVIGNTSIWAGRWGGAARDDGAAVAAGGGSGTVALTVMHELGHSFGWLGDEYSRGTQPWLLEWGEPDDPNLTLESRRANAKWRNLLQNDPIGGGTIGDYSGRLFHPERTCKMHDPEDRYCTVCNYVITKKILDLSPPAVHTTYPIYSNRHVNGSGFLAHGFTDNAERVDVTVQNGSTLESRTFTAILEPLQAVDLNGDAVAGRYDGRWKVWIPSDILRIPAGNDEIGITVTIEASNSYFEDNNNGLIGDEPVHTRAVTDIPRDARVRVGSPTLQDENGDASIDASDATSQYASLSDTMTRGVYLTNIGNGSVASAAGSPAPLIVSSTGTGDFVQLNGSNFDSTVVVYSGTQLVPSAVLSEHALLIAASETPDGLLTLQRGDETGTVVRKQGTTFTPVVPWTVSARMMLRAPEFSVLRIRLDAAELPPASLPGAASRIEVTAVRNGVWGTTVVSDALLESGELLVPLAGTFGGAPESVRIDLSATHPGLPPFVATIAVTGSWETMTLHDRGTVNPTTSVSSVSGSVTFSSTAAIAERFTFWAASGKSYSFCVGGHSCPLDRGDANVAVMIFDAQGNLISDLDDHPIVAGSNQTLSVVVWGLGPSTDSYTLSLLEERAASVWVNSPTPGQTVSHPFTLSGGSAAAGEVWVSVFDSGRGMVTVDERRVAVDAAGAWSTPIDSSEVTAGQWATITIVGWSGLSGNGPWDSWDFKIQSESGELFFDDFSQNLGWSFSHPWQRGPAQASTYTGWFYGNRDPSTDYSAGDDNSLLGASIGGLVGQPEGVHEYYYATSPAIDTSGRTGVTLSFARFLNSDYPPYMTNVVEVFNGSSWVNLWTSQYPGPTDADWSLQQFDVSAYTNASFRVRFGYNVGSSGVYPVHGWSVDDVKIAAGGSSSPPADTTPPSASILIDGGASGTSSTSVTLTLSASDAGGIWGYKVWNAGFNEPQYTMGTPPGSMGWSLPYSDATQTVYFRVRDNAGIETLASDSITVMSAPSVSIASPSYDGATVSASGFTVSGSSSNSTSVHVSVYDSGRGSYTVSNASASMSGGSWSFWIAGSQLTPGATAWIYVSGYNGSYGYGPTSIRSVGVAAAATVSIASPGYDGASVPTGFTLSGSSSNASAVYVSVYDYARGWTASNLTADFSGGSWSTWIGSSLLTAGYEAAIYVNGWNSGSGTGPTSYRVVSVQFGQPYISIWVPTYLSTVSASGFSAGGGSSNATSVVVSVYDTYSGSYTHWYAPAPMGSDGSWSAWIGSGKVTPGYLAYVIVHGYNPSFGYGNGYMVSVNAGS